MFRILSSVQWVMAYHYNGWHPNQRRNRPAVLISLVLIIRKWVYSAGNEAYLLFLACLMYGTGTISNSFLTHFRYLDHHSMWGGDIKCIHNIVPCPHFNDIHGALGCRINDTCHSSEWSLFGRTIQKRRCRSLGVFEKTTYVNHLLQQSLSYCISWGPT